MNISTPIDTIFPVIISASRATDIPAFHAKWFMQQLRQGFTIWENPYNKKKYTVSFEKTKFIVFWTKNFAPMLPYIKELDDLGLFYYIQYTLNDYETENWEPQVPQLIQRIQTFQALSEKIGKEKILWRFDPLLLTPITPLPILLQKVKNIGDILHPFTEKLIFSFADIAIYRKVQQRFNKHNIPWIEWNTATMQAFAASLAQLNTSWNLQLASCAEEIDLADFNISHNSCIDAQLIERISAKDNTIKEYFKTLQNQNFVKPLKDKGQRKLCRCAPSKDIGKYNTCGHHCIYCYANT